jgi:chromosome segregation ATPase
MSLADSIDLTAIIGVILTALIGAVARVWVTIRKHQAENEQLDLKAKQDADAAIVKAKQEAEHARDELYRELHDEVRAEVHERRGEVQRLTNELAITQRNISTLENLNNLLKLQVEDKTREVVQLRDQVANLNSELSDRRNK